MSLKEIAIDFLTLVVKGEAKIAFNLYVSTEFIHHNPWFPADANSLMCAMETDAINQPKKSFELISVIEERNLVAVHSRVVLKNSLKEIALAHFFKMENFKIVELWDIGQEAPDITINTKGMF
ncbi:MAG: nuclear transport factor 2 family protein [Flavobacteriales bacterium]|nr:nuclear transport factor 2 family protein [Flavobacteriales bacterium]